MICGADACPNEAAGLAVYIRDDTPGKACITSQALGDYAEAWYICDAHRAALNREARCIGPLVGGRAGTCLRRTGHDSSPYCPRCLGEYLAIGVT